MCQALERAQHVCNQSALTSPRKRVLFSRITDGDLEAYRVGGGLVTCIGSQVLVYSDSFYSSCLLPFRKQFKLCYMPILYLDLSALISISQGPPTSKVTCKHGGQGLNVLPHFLIGDTDM